MTASSDSKTAMEVSIIIPVHNRCDLTLACLESIALHAPEDLSCFNYEIIVVDNASNDDTQEAVSAKGSSLFGSRFKCIRHDENLNFAGGCNSGAGQASGRRLLFLNNDTLMNPLWFTPLWETLENEEDKAGGIGAVSPLLLYPQNTVQHLGIAFQVGGVVHLYAHFPASHPLINKFRTGFQAITGAVMLLDSEFFKLVGGFHQGYVNGYEDLELCLRIREQGKSLACIPKSRIYHLESQTPGRNANETHNAALFAARAGYGFKTDVHEWVAPDGYALRFSPYLDTIIEIDSGRKRSFAPMLDAMELLGGPDTLAADIKNNTRLYDLAIAGVAALQQEPLWPEAYAPACVFLEKVGYSADALALRFLQSRFYASVEGLLAWAKIATRTKNMEQAKYAGNMAKLYVIKQEDKAKTIKLALSQLGRAEKNQDTALAIMLKNWLLLAGVSVNH